MDSLDQFLKQNNHKPVGATKNTGVKT